MEWQPTLVFLPGESHGRRSLVGYTPCSCKESDKTERLTLHFTSSRIYKESSRTKMWTKMSPKKIYKWQVSIWKHAQPYCSFSSVQFSHSVVSDSATSWIAAHQASLSITNSQSSLRLTSIESVMPSSHLILCCPLLLLPPIPPSIRVFSNESALRMRWPKYWEFQL